MDRPKAARRERLTTATAERSGVENPWGPPDEIATGEAQHGANMALFGYAGCGKTTLITTARKAATGSPLLVVNFDPDIQSLKNRNDISLWPKKGRLTWDRADSFLSRLLTGKHPFKTLCFDTGNNFYRLAIREVRAKGSDRRDPRQIYGEANDMINARIMDFASYSQETGCNIIWAWHAEDVVEGQGDSARLYVRPDATPGVLKTIYQYHSTIGYLEERTGGKRRLYLHNTPRVIAKVHQPLDDDAVAVEIDDPDLGKLIDHLRGNAKYDTAGKTTALRNKQAG